MGMHTLKALRCIAASRRTNCDRSRLGRDWTKAIEAGHAARDPAPSAAKPERITEFFTNELATGKSPLARINANWWLATMKTSISESCPSQKSFLVSRLAFDKRDLGALLQELC
jgi:hypothetical protein